MDIKKYKKEQEKKTPYQKISTALSAVKYNIKRPHDISMRLEGIKKHKKGMAAKMRLEKSLGEHGAGSKNWSENTRAEMGRRSAHARTHPDDDEYDQDR